MLHTRSLFYRVGRTYHVAQDATDSVRCRPRLDQLRDAIEAIRWENGTVAGLEW